MLFLIFTFIGYAFCEEMSSTSLKDLKNQADEILKLSNVSARADVDTVFKLVDRLLEENQQEDAET